MGNDPITSWATIKRSTIWAKFTMYEILHSTILYNCQSSVAYSNFFWFFISDVSFRFVINRVV